MPKQPWKIAAIESVCATLCSVTLVVPATSEHQGLSSQELLYPLGVSPLMRLPYLPTMSVPFALQYVLSLFSGGGGRLPITNNDTMRRTEA